MQNRIVVLFLFLLTSSFLQAERLVLVSASYGKNILAITEANGDVIWSYKTAGKEKGHAGHHDVHMLSNGNILITETTEEGIGIKFLPSRKVAVTFPSFVSVAVVSSFVAALSISS